jgi:acetoin utilization deacetylase AcuC-like enzyme
MRNDRIATFYRPEQVVTANLERSFSKSPLKPKLVVEALTNSTARNAFFTKGTFPPFDRREFLLAHTKEYVDAFFSGKQPLCSSNGLPWSEELSQSVRYTNASLYYAILHSLENPSQVSFSPTSGFHHATPEHGRGFCTFSGQVIASSKLYKERKVSGAWVDLDAHFGNSIEDSRHYVRNLNLAIPIGCNINPTGLHRSYIEDFQRQLNQLEALIVRREVHYVVFCHGADSHEKDDTGKGQCTTEEWLECSQIFYHWVKLIDQKLGRPLPVTLTLFGGYRADDYQSVLDLHLADLLSCANILGEHSIEFNLGNSKTLLEPTPNNEW